MDCGSSGDIVTAFGMLTISSTRSRSQLISTIRGSPCDFFGTVGRDSSAPRLSHCTPRIWATFCHGRWCIRLSGLMMAAVRTASTNERTTGRSWGSARPPPPSRLRIRAISMARKHKSMRACLPRIPSFGAMSFEMVHLRRML